MGGRELHDGIGQTLASVLLDLKQVADGAPGPVREERHQVRESTRAGLDGIRRIARRLLPGVLKELGLARALCSLAAEFAGPSMSVCPRITPRLPASSDDADLVVYRVAQESLINAGCHAAATRVDLTHWSGRRTTTSTSGSATTAGARAVPASERVSVACASAPCSSAASPHSPPRPVVVPRSA